MQLVNYLWKCLLFIYIIGALISWDIMWVNNSKDMLFSIFCWGAYSFILAGLAWMIDNPHHFDDLD